MHKLIVTLCIEDAQIRCKTPIELNATDQYTWLDPFSIDGVALNSQLIFKIWIETRHKHTVLVQTIQVNVSQLSYKKQRVLLKGRRNSIHNTVKYVDVADKKKDVHSIRIDNLELSYVAELYADLARLQFASLCLELVPGTIRQLTSRDKLQITLNSYYKANRVYTYENTKYFTWIFDPNSNISSSANNQDVLEYDCDQDVSDENHPIYIMPPSIVGNEEGNGLQLTFKRTVFFPLNESGMEPKYMHVHVAQHSLDTNLGVYETAPFAGIIVKVHFDAMYTITSITLIVERFKDTIENIFKI